MVEWRRSAVAEITHNMLEGTYEPFVGGRICHESGCGGLCARALRDELLAEGC